MAKPMSRRHFLQRATATGGSLLLSGNAMASLCGGGDRAGDSSPQADALDGGGLAAESYDSIVRRPVFNERLDPHWLADNRRFWYRKDAAGGRSRYVLIDAEHGKRADAFDHKRLAAALAQATGDTYDAERLPIFDAALTAAALLFTLGTVRYRCDLATYALTTVAGNEDVNRAPKEPDAPHATRVGANVAPDGKWTVVVEAYNVSIRSATGILQAITSDGTADRPYGEPEWSPDSRTLVFYRMDPAEEKPVYMVESSPKDGGTRGVLHQHGYPQAGDPFTRYEMWVAGGDSWAAVKIAIEPQDYGDTPTLHWRADGRSFLFERTERGHQRFRVIEADAATGATETIYDERSSTFINTNHAYSYYMQTGDEMILASEKDGWRHLYLVDVKRGGTVRPITGGAWVVRSVDHVDESAREIWFQASGVNADEDPYHLHFYRVNFDGSGLVALTSGNGTHRVAYSPDRKYLIDTYSRADLPPVHELRRVADGALVCELERADISALTGAGWRLPEVFSAKGRDGVTDIWGVVYRPTRLDLAAKYPVIENIYAGPQESFVRKDFHVRDGMQELADRGFVVIQCDGMGTRNRSKAFHDVCWRNLKDAGLPDRILFIKALALKSPYCDASRVGIYGTSAGGQNSTGALLFHPEFYKVAVSSCGCHDNRIDKRWWNEQWMGYPVGPWYADSSNIEHASNLRGKLMLMVGELDSNVPPESTLRLADALIKAGKDFDLLVLPGMDHTGGGTYGERRRQDFFVKHLLGIEPPDRNAPQPERKPVTLTPLPPSEAAFAQSEGGTDTTVEFRNDTPASVTLFWLSAPGARVSYGELKPGEVHLQHTYAGHAWLVADRNGQPLAVFVAEERPGIAEVSRR